MYHGAILYEEEQLARFFDREVLEAYNVTVAIPLIIENQLYGFIFIANKTAGDFNSDDINSSTRQDTLQELTLKTLDISIDMEKAFIALYDKENDIFNITNTLNLELKSKELKPNDNWKRVLEGDSVYETREERILKFISKAFMKELGEVP
jgi:hypothetical protein